MGGLERLRGGLGGGEVGGRPRRCPGRDRGRTDPRRAGRHRPRRGAGGRTVGNVGAASRGWSFGLHWQVPSRSGLAAQANPGKLGGSAGRRQTLGPRAWQRSGVRRRRRDVQTYPTWPNLRGDDVRAGPRQWPDRPMLRGFRDGAGTAPPGASSAAPAASAARGLRAAGVAAGDRVVIVAENRPEYPIAETALMAIRAVPVPTYITNTVDDHAHILRDCGATGGDRLLRRAGRAAAGGRRARRRARPAGGDGRRAGGRGRHAAAAALGASWSPTPPPPDDIARRGRRPFRRARWPACIYTSGTGGAPRGVMLPHRAILSNCRGAFELVRPLRLKDEVYLSFLPISHSYEHTVGQFFLPSARHRDRLCARRRASGGRPADGAPDHPDRGAARAGGDPRPRAGPGGARASLAAGAVRPRPGDRPASASTTCRSSLAERVLDPAAGPAGAAPRCGRGSAAG